MPGFMKLKLALVACLTGGFYTTAADQAKASDLQVAATITPVHSLVSMVTEGITSPELIVRPGASPHGYAMKPSEAQALDSADVVFWVGDALEPWMEKAVTTLASDAVVVELAGIKGVEHLAFREGGVWEGHDHGGDAHDEHGHDEAGHDDHGHDEKAHDDHGHDDESS